MKSNREATPLFTTISQEDPHVLGLFNLYTAQKKIDSVIEYTPNWSGRIAGNITGRPDDIKKVFAALENNEPVGVRDLIESIKYVRSKIFQAKQLNSEARRWSGKGPR